VTPNVRAVMIAFGLALTTSFVTASRGLNNAGTVEEIMVGGENIELCP
jgi:hypothetical protein